MYTYSHRGRWLGLPALATLLLLWAARPGPAPAVQPEPFTIVLPLIVDPPATLAVADETDLLAAIAAANNAGQMPRIELVADVFLSAPPPGLDNPGAAAATLAGNGFSLDGNGKGPILTVGPGTAVIVENLTIRNGVGECGGGIYSEGLLEIRQSRIINNRADNGGGICVHSAAMPAILTLVETTIAGNDAAGSGGGVYAGSADAATLEEAVSVAVTATGALFEGNTAGSYGGGLFATAGANTRATLTLVESTLSGNHAGTGGGVSTMTDQGFMVTALRRSTIANNSAATAAGVHNHGATGQTWYSGGHAGLTISNSTISGNIASGDGGAIANIDVPEPFSVRKTPQVPPPIGGAYLTMTFTTVTANKGNRGGGLWNTGQVSLQAVIVAGNENAGGECDGPGSYASGGYNLDGDSSCGLSAATDRPGRSPGLLPLALNAPGKTATHALDPASPARDMIPLGAIDLCSPWVVNPDQRGVARPQPAGWWCDSGAFEWAAGD